MKSLVPTEFPERVHPLNGAISELVDVQVASPFASDTSTLPRPGDPQPIVIWPERYRSFHLVVFDQRFLTERGADESGIIPHETEIFVTVRLTIVSTKSRPVRVRSPAI